MTATSPERESQPSAGGTPPGPPADAAPAADETLTFHFHDGRQWRCVDPWKVERLLARGLKGQSVSRVIEESRQPVDAIASPALDLLLSAVCLAFGLTPVQEDGSGHTERTQVRVLTAFLRWKAEVKKNTAPPATSSPATAPQSSPAPSPPRNGSPPG
jgi:hypothetical protein